MERERRVRTQNQHARADCGHLGASREEEGVERNRGAAISSNALTEADKAEALARFRSLHARGGVRLSFVAFGPIVQARQPAELELLTGTTATDGADDFIKMPTESYGQKPTH